MPRLIKPARLAALGAVGLAAVAAAGSAPVATTAAAQTRECFRALDWRGSSSGGPRDLYIRVNQHDVWHLGLAQDCPGARIPGAVRIDDLVTGNNEICSPADLQIRVAPQGFPNATACIVATMNRLTPEELKALPRKAIP